LRNIVSLAARGATSRKLNVCDSLVAASKTVMKPPPPMPELIGCSTPRQSAEPTAASIARPPRRSSSAPTSEHVFESVATAPWRPGSVCTGSQRPSTQSASVSSRRISSLGETMSATVSGAASRSLKPTSSTASSTRMMLPPMIFATSFSSSFFESSSSTRRTNDDTSSRPIGISWSTPS
jgi:hypothetical protein